MELVLLRLPSGRWLWLMPVEAVTKHPLGLLQRFFGFALPRRKGEREETERLRRAAKAENQRQAMHAASLILYLFDRTHGERDGWAAFLQDPALRADFPTGPSSAPGPGPATKPSASSTGRRRRTSKLPKAATTANPAATRTRTTPATTDSSRSTTPRTSARSSKSPARRTPRSSSTQRSTSPSRTSSTKRTPAGRRGRAGRADRKP